MSSQSEGPQVGDVEWLEGPQVGDVEWLEGPQVGDSIFDVLSHTQEFFF